jgi:hypothetical protein
VSLEVSGGTGVAVTTEALLEAERLLGLFAERAAAVRVRLSGLGSAARADGLGGAVLIERAGHELAEAIDDARLLAAQLAMAAEAYGWAERLATARQQFLAELLGPQLALSGLFLVAGFDAARPDGPDFADPALVAALRALADSVDLAAVTALVQWLPGRELEETPVAVARTGAPHTAGAPGGFAELARRIPSAGDGSPQLRVERYELPNGEVRWILYSAGTAEWGPVPGDDPWDLTSDVVGVAGGSAGSSRAAVLALRAAGWQPGEPVVPVGHSQGGIVATAVATSGLAATPLLVTFGSPSARAEVPRGVVDVAVEHRDDPVPALGGSPRPLLDQRLLVRERAPGTAQGASPHAMSGYRQTAAEMDSSSDARLVAARTSLAEFTGGRPATVTMWRGERVLVSGGPAGSAAGR